MAPVFKSLMCVDYFSSCNSSCEELFTLSYKSCSYADNCLAIQSIM